MSNILDYLDWRGDLTLRESPFCEVDNLILTQISFMDLSGIADGTSPFRAPTMAQAAKSYFARQTEKKQDFGLILPEQLPDLFRRAAESRRFGEMRLLRYESILDPKTETQFAALCIRLGDGGFFVSYRGTDDTLVGWKENFNMGYLDAVPAQTHALRYLTEAAKHIPGRIVVGGHSKGGNLALYAAVKAPASVKRRIRAVYNNDGPGFLEKITDTPEYLAIRDRIHTIVPQFSVVGLLLEHGPVDEVIRSNGSGLWQHDPCTWEVLGNRFVMAEGLTKESARIERTIKAWIADMPVEKRREMIEAMYKAFTVGNAQTLSDIAADKWDFIKSLGKLDERERDVIFSMGKLLLREGFKAVQEDREKNDKKPLFGFIGGKKEEPKA